MGGLAPSFQSARTMPKEPSEVRVNSLTGWRKAIKRVASLEETALCEIDSLYDHLIPTPEQEEWIQEKIRLLKDESDAIADGTKEEAFERQAYFSQAGNRDRKTC